jgi:hypothetical protein
MLKKLLTAAGLAVTGVSALTLGGCAREPTLSSVIYRGIGPNAILLTPQASPPGEGSAAYKTNDFAYTPGAFAVPGAVLAERDLVAGRAEVWATVPWRYCSQSKIPLNKTIVSTLPDLIDDYKLEAVFPLDIIAWLNKAKFRETYSDLRPNEIGKLKRVTISLTNIRSYELSPDQARAIIEPNEGSKCVRDYLRRGFRVVKVSKVVIANLAIQNESGSGFRLALGPLKANDLSRFKYARETDDPLIVAIIPQ